MSATGKFISADRAAQLGCYNWRLAARWNTTPLCLVHAKQREDCSVLLGFVRPQLRAGNGRDASRSSVFVFVCFFPCFSIFLFFFFGFSAVETEEMFRFSEISLVYNARLFGISSSNCITLRRIAFLVFHCVLFSYLLNVINSSVRLLSIFNLVSFGLQFYPQFYAIISIDTVWLIYIRYRSQLCKHFGRFVLIMHEQRSSKVIQMYELMSK